VDEYVYTNSHKTVQSFCAYSIMDRPMTSCGCFEVICAYLPECNGIMAVNREYLEDTPVGMSFSTLAGTVGGGQQTPGFMGCGKIFLTSKKFLFADGGHRRLVWMTKELKTLLGEDLQKRFAEQGVPDQLDKIADETIASDALAVRDYMIKGGHPALEMPDITLLADAAKAESPVGSIAAAAVAHPAEAGAEPIAERTDSEEQTMTPEQLAHLKESIKREIVDEVKQSLTRDIVRGIIQTLGEKFLDQEMPSYSSATVTAAPPAAAAAAAAPPAPATKVLMQELRKRLRRNVSAQWHPLPSAEKNAKCRSGWSNLGPPASKAAHEAKPIRSAAKPPCRFISGKARCRIARCWPWKFSITSVKNILRCCAKSMATCCSSRLRWPAAVLNNTALT
jgi:hypothetical protein